MRRTTSPAIFALALFAFAPTAQAQQATPPALWTGEAGVEAVGGSHHEYPGERAIGDVLTEITHAYRRTARLASAYTADFQGAAISLPAGTPMVARHTPDMLQMSGTGRRPERVRPRTIIWCALPESGQAPCFFWDAAQSVRGRAPMSGGVLGARGWFNETTLAPMPDIAEQAVDLPPSTTRVILLGANPKGYVTQQAWLEDGVSRSHTSRQRPWGVWDYVDSRQMRATPLRDADGSVRGATVEFRDAPARQ